MLDSIQFNSFSEFLDMGGYAFNVWSVYLLFVIFVTVNLLGPLRSKKQIIRQLKRRAVLNATYPNSSGGGAGPVNAAATAAEKRNGERPESGEMP